VKQIGLTQENMTSAGNPENVACSGNPENLTNSGI